MTKLNITVQTCKKCGVEKGIEKFELCKRKCKDGFRYYRLKTCRRCRKNRDQELRPYIKNESFQRLKKWKAENRGTIEGFIYSNLSRWRKRSSVKSDLTFDYLMNLWNEQSGNCFYTKVPLDNISPGTTRKQLTLCNRLMNSPSLDKLYPDKGYVIGNVVWCSYSINSMKWDRTIDEFLDTCKTIVEGSYFPTPQGAMD